MKSFLVIGLGRFGTSLACELCALGHEVMAVDLREERVQEVAGSVTHAAAGDARDPEVLRALGARNFDCAVVSAGDDVGTSALIVLNLKEMALRLARNLANGDILNFIELSEEYSIMECRCPRQWQGKSIRELDVRARHRLNIIAIRRGGGMTISPGGEYALQEEDELVVLGRNEDIREVERL